MDEMTLTGEHRDTGKETCAGVPPSNRIGTDRVPALEDWLLAICGRAQAKHYFDWRCPTICEPKSYLSLTSVFHTRYICITIQQIPNQRNDHNYTFRISINKTHNYANK